MKYIIVLLSTSFIIGPYQVVLAQQNNQILSEAWGDGTGFTMFEWSRAEDKTKLHSDPVFTVVNLNSLEVYNTYKRDPLGSFTRCGGLGCDLGKGQLIGTLNFESNGNLFTVQSATGKASYLQGAQCRLLENYMTVLECTSTRTPNPSSQMPSIFRFMPGT